MSVSPCEYCDRTDLKCCITCGKDASNCDVMHNCGEDCSEYTPRIITNRDRIKNMSDDDLSFILMCPYDTSGEPADIMPCVTDESLPSQKKCCDCIKAWLGKEAKEENSHG